MPNRSRAGRVVLGLLVSGAILSGFGPSFACAPDTPRTSCLRWEGPSKGPLPRAEGVDCTPPLLFGHRGAWKVWAPENTMPAFRCAEAQGADGLEIDLQISADGHVVAMHDSTPDRTTNATGGRRVDEMSWAELSELDAGAWFHEDYRGLRIPRLDTIVAEQRDTQLRLLWDVKDIAVIEPLLETLRREDLLTRSIVSSTQLAVLEAAAEAPELELLYYPTNLDADLPRLEAAGLPGLRYLRVPKAVADDPASLQQIVDAGYEAATGEYRVDYRYGLGLVDDMDAVWSRVAPKMPEACGG